MSRIPEHNWITWSSDRMGYVTPTQPLQVSPARRIRSSPPVHFREAVPTGPREARSKIARTNMVQVTSIYGVSFFSLTLTTSDRQCYIVSTGWGSRVIAKARWGTLSKFAVGDEFGTIIPLPAAEARCLPLACKPRIVRLETTRTFFSNSRLVASIASSSLARP